MNTSNFNWGLSIQTFEVGPYSILEYHPYKSDGARITKVIDNETTQYHGYIDGKDTHESYETLDDALAGLIVRRSLGTDHSQINQHFIAGIAALSALEI
jgi:hypothetical protein